MHQAARKCCYWACFLFVVGIGAVAFGPGIYSAISRGVGANAEAGLSLLNLTITILKNACLPTAGALVGAAVVINVLAGAAANSSQNQSNPDSAS